MRVKCISQSGKDLPPSCMDKQAGYDAQTKFSIKVGESYVVYAMTTYLNHVWYHIWDENSTFYPRWNPSPLFTIIDGRLSKYWIANSRRDDSDFVFLVGYNEWVQNHEHVNKLVDNDPSAVSIFMKYKELMDSEYSDIQTM